MVSVRIVWNTNPASRRTLEQPMTTVRLAHGAYREQETAALHHRADAPALLVSYVYLKPFLKNRERYYYRDWVMDSGAYSAHNSGTKIELAAYIDACHGLLATDPTLTEVFALDVIGDYRASAANVAAMWDAGIPAIPTYHYGEPEGVLIDLAAGYPKIAVGGVVRLLALTMVQACL